jgi:hypothetical protein
VLAAAAGRRETMGSPEDEMDRPTVLAFPVTRSRRGRDRGPARTPAGAAAPRALPAKVPLLRPPRAPLGAARPEASSPLPGCPRGQPIGPIIRHRSCRPRVARGGSGP